MILIVLSSYLFLGKVRLVSAPCEALDELGLPILGMSMASSHEVHS